ncbi:MAG: flagellin [Pseudomonadota bacterium]
MTISNLPNIVSALTLSRTVSDLKPKLVEAQQEAVTGQISDLNAAKSGEVGSVLSLRKSISDAETYRAGVILGSTRAAIAQEALGRVEEGLTAFATDILSTIELEEQPRLTVIAEDARGRLETAVSALNIRHGDRSLFAGSAVDGPAIASADDIISQVSAILAAAPDAATAEADLALFFDDPAGGFFGGVYLGDSGDSGITQTGALSSIDYGQRADDSAIRDVIKGLAVLAAHDDAGFSGDIDETKQLLGYASGALLDADDGVTRMRGTLGAAEARLDEARTYLEATTTTLNIALNEETGVDQFEAATLFQNLSTQLETAYISSARLASLNFANFIR